MNSTQSNLKSVFNSDGTRKMAQVKAWRMEQEASGVKVTNEAYIAKMQEVMGA